MQLGKCCVRVADLDRGHAHLPGRFEVHPEVVEKHHLRRVHGQRLEGYPVERVND